MVNVFLSYHRQDKAKARPVATAIEQAGHSVWWDQNIQSGAQYSKEIEEALKRAHVVVVLWSETAVESAWVRDEAAAGRDRGRLIPLTLDGTEPPLGFRQYQTMDISRGSRRWKSAQIATLVETIASVASGKFPPTAPAKPRHSSPAFVDELLARPWMLIALMIGLATLAFGLFISRPWERKAPSLSTVAVTAANKSPASQDLARDLLAQLGQFQATRPDALQLTSPEAGLKGSLILEVAGERDGSQSRANLVLVDAKSKNVLWSTTIERPTREASDLRQQLGYTAAQVLECTAEARPDGRSILSSRSLVHYLNGCAAYADKTPEKLQMLVSQFRQLTKEEPGFADGWAKLLVVESDFTRVPTVPDTAVILRSLPAHIRSARAVDREMPEAFLAEAILLPEGAFERRIGLLRQALDSVPNNSAVLSFLSDHLRFVGRANESIEIAQRAVQADPLSPTIRNTLVEAFTYAGKTDAALSEINRMEQIWPGATNLVFSRFIINLRYGDAKEAMRAVRTGSIPIAQSPYLESFLQARVNPSAANVRRAIADAEAWYEKDPTTVYHLVQVLGTFGREERLFALLLNWPHPDKVVLVADGLFRPAMKKAHRDARMMTVAKRLGLLNYWRKTSEWPDFCFEPDLPYDCKAEAAKLG